MKPSGPDHDHAVASLELADRVTVPPAHIGPLFVAPVEDGTGFTETTPTVEIFAKVDTVQVVVHQ